MNGFFRLRLTKLISCSQVHFFQKCKIEPPSQKKKKGDGTFQTAHTLSLPPLASSPNNTTSSPGLNVEIVGGSGVLIVVDGS